jgi:hypothetical protein
MYRLYFNRFFCTQEKDRLDVTCVTYLRYLSDEELPYSVQFFVINSLTSPPPQDTRVVQTFRAPTLESDTVKFAVYTCDENPPVNFVSEDGCRLLAHLFVPVVPGEMAELELSFKVGFTEISAEVTNKGNGEVVATQVLFDFQKKEEHDEN